MKLLKNNIGLFVAIFFGVLSVVSLFHSGLPPTHDGEYHVIRFYEFDNALRAGSWYPVWAANLNYTFGVPLFGYVYPLPNYIASFFHLLDISFIDAFKINLILASILGAITSFLLGKEKFGVWGGVITSVFYTFAPYHFLDIYVRGSVGEVWALAFFPLGLLLLDKLFKKKTVQNIIYFGLCYALIIFSHNILAVMFSAFAGSYALLLVLSSKSKKNTKVGIISGFTLGFLLSAVFFIPALLEQKFVVGLKIYDVTTSFAELYELIIPSWGSGFAGVGTGAQMSFQIGIINLLVVIIAILLLTLRKFKKNTYLIFFLLIWFFILCFLMTAYSVKIWEIMPIMSYFQFPWRLLSLVILITSLLAGSIAIVTKRQWVYLLLIVLVLLTTYSYAHPAHFLERNDEYYISSSNFIHGTNSIGNVFQTKWFPLQKKLPSSSNNSNHVVLLSRDSIKQTYQVSLPKDQLVMLNTSYFPGWIASVNNKNVPVLNKSGKLGVNLENGNYQLELRFTDTPIRFFSKLISIIAVVVVLTLLLRMLVIQYFSENRN